MTRRVSGDGRGLVLCSTWALCSGIGAIFKMLVAVLQVDIPGSASAIGNVEVSLD